MNQVKKLTTKQKWLLIEGVILFLGMPFLLFPDVIRWATFGIVLTLTGLWLAQVVVKIRPPFPPTVIRIASIILGIQAGLAVVVSFDDDLTFTKTASLFLGVALLRYLSYFITDRKTLSMSVLVFILMGLGLTGVGILTADWSRQKVDFVQAIIRQLPSFADLLPSGRTGGTHTNQIGGSILYYIFLLPVLIPVLWRRKGLALLVGILFVGMTGLMILTQSRSGWMGFAGGFGLLMILYSLVMLEGNARFVVRVSTVFLTVLTVGMIVMLVVSGRFSEIWADPNVDTAVGSLGTIKFRQEVWEWGLIAAEDFLFTGTGLGTFREVVHRLYPIAVPVTYDIAHAHNQFLQVQLDLGLFGLIAYTSMLILAVQMCWQVARHSVDLRHIAIGLLCCMVSFHIYGLTDAIALGAKPGILWWMLLGLVVGMHRVYIAERITQNEIGD